MDKCDLPQKEQYSSMGIVKSRASEEGTRQPEDSSSSPKKNDIPPMVCIFHFTIFTTNIWIFSFLATRRVKITSLSFVHVDKR